MKVISIKSSAVYVSDRSLLHFIFCICVPLETIYDSCVVYVDRSIFTKECAKCRNRTMIFSKLFLRDA